MISEAGLLPEKAWEDLLAWYRRSGRHDLPWRRTPMPWSILVAETLLHRTRADAVERIFPALIERFPSPEAVTNAPEAWEEGTYSAGLRWRVKGFVETCRILQERHSGGVPRSQDELEALPGVGHYIATAVRVFGFGMPGVVVDTNTIRVAGRVSGTELDPTRHRSRVVQATVSALEPGSRFPSPDANYALLDLAALVCVPREPRCADCPIVRFCATGRERTGTGILK
jgi:A/G-specific adenine glycosylase